MMTLMDFWGMSAMIGFSKNRPPSNDGYFAGPKHPGGGDAPHDEENPNRHHPEKETRRRLKDNNMILDSDHEELLHPAAYTKQHNMFHSGNMNHGNSLETQRSAVTKEGVAPGVPHLITHAAAAAGTCPPPC